MKTDTGSGNTHHFFGFGKRIPTNVKRHCGMCKQHNVLVETRGHVCSFKNCNCDKCKLVRRRREIMSTQIRLRREQDKKFKRTTDETEADIIPGNSGHGPTETSTCYFCQKCKNHGVLMWKKDHKKKCAYANCTCDQCELIDSRRALDRHIKKPSLGSIKEDLMDDSSSNSTSQSSSESSSSRNSTTGSMHFPVVKQEIPFVLPSTAEFLPTSTTTTFPFWPIDPMFTAAPFWMPGLSQLNMQFLISSFNAQMFGQEHQ